MRRFALSAIGRDRPGIVAGLAADLLAHGVNLEDSQMSILHGHFTVVLVVAGSDDLDVERLRADLERTAERLGLDALSLSDISDGGAGEDVVPAQADPAYIVTVYGVDHPGIVHAVAQALAARDMNITDLQTRLVAEEPGREGIYAMMLELTLPVGATRADLERVFDEIRDGQGVQATVRELDQDAL